MPEIYPKSGNARKPIARPRCADGFGISGRPSLSGVLKNRSGCPPTVAMQRLDHRTAPRGSEDERARSFDIRVQTLSAKVATKIGLVLIIASATERYDADGASLPVPVEPKPRTPRVVSSTAATSRMSACTIGAKTN